jgi:hydroxylamine dehydrogenase
MWEHDVIKLYKGLVHSNPGGFTYTEGWSELMRDYAIIMDENTKLREGKGSNSQSSANDPDARTKSFAQDVSGRPLLGSLLIGFGFVMMRRKK